MEATRRLLLPLPPRAALAGMAIICFNLIDAFGTLRHLQHGAIELNPLMDVLIRAGHVPFVVVKHLLASLGIVAILLHQEVPAARLALRILVPVYAGIAIYQLVLLSTVASTG